MIKSRPLIRFKLTSKHCGAFPFLTNEHFGALLFFTLTIYSLPLFIRSPIKIVNFTLVVLLSLLIDTVGGFIRYKRPVCAVTGSITGGLLAILLHALPLPIQLAATGFALICGKHLQGGTGKNITNPAMLGLLPAALLFPTEVGLFGSSPLLSLLAMLALPFLLFRPFAGLGLTLGLCLALFIGGLFSWQNVMSYGLPLFCCLVVTDPVTTTHRPLTGLLLSFTAGLCALTIFTPFLPPMGAMALALLTVNCLSRLADRFLPSVNLSRLFPLRLGKAIPPYSQSAAPGRMVQARHTLEGLNSTILAQKLEEYDICGLGGASFPTARKIEAFLDSTAPVKRLIINGAECDPGLIHDHWLLRHRTKQFMLGVKSLQHCLPLDDTVLAVKDSRGLTLPGQLKIKKLPKLYPIGAEPLLIESILGKGAVTGKIPAQKGVLVLNVQTVYAIYKALFEPERLAYRYITAADLKENVSRVVEVEYGAKLESLASELFTQKGRVYKGGGLMQAVEIAADDVVDHSTNGLYRADAPRYKESLLCSRCSLCIMHCPAGLDVRQICDDFERFGKSDRLKRLAQSCLNCGSCSYLCLAGRHLAGTINSCKG